MITSTEISKQRRAYELSFMIENILRVSMHNLMVKKVGPNYFTEKIFPEYEYGKFGDKNEPIKINVVNSAKQRRGSEREYNILLRYDYPYFWYLDFSVLISLIDKFWEKYFNSILTKPNKKLKKDIILRLNHILPVRNAIAHHRYVSNIDIKDLESLFSVLNSSLNKDHIDNFEELALNSLEKMVEHFLVSCEEIKKMITKGKYLDESKLRKFTNSFSAIISSGDIKKGIKEFDKVFALIGKYNKLPRKPGSGDEIEFFRKNTEIDEKIDNLSKIVGDSI